MVKVIVKEDQTVDSALKIFKRKVNNDGLLKELRDKEYYVKPGVKKRLKHEAAVRQRNKTKKR